MGQFNASSVIAAQKSFRALFLQNSELAMAEATWPKVAMEIPSDSAEENYNWFGTTPTVKEWLDTKTLDALRGFDFLIKNRDWEATMQVDRNDFEDDKLGTYRPRISEMGKEAMLHLDGLVSEVRVAGSAALCYDGQFFYDTDHVEGESGTLSNIVTGTGVAVANIYDDFGTARARMRTFKDDRGRPRIRRQGSLQLLATIPPGLEKVFEELNNPAPGATTPRVVLPYVVDPYLADANDWYLDYIGGSVKPFVAQINRRPDFVSLEDPNSSEIVFMRKKILFGTEARYNAGYGLWYMSVKATNT